MAVIAPTASATCTFVSLRYRRTRSPIWNRLARYVAFVIHDWFKPDEIVNTVDAAPPIAVTVCAVIALDGR